ncbi:MAG TPA: DUF4142 domain-containing protein [Rickettsiales bacterium]|nr:DUF4142 domain-containing protein [Rickettsiales bacterium]
MRLRHILATASILGAVCLGSAAYANNYSTKDFVEKAAVAGKFEIESSQLALTKAHDSDVKDFAQKMIDDHTDVDKKLHDTVDSNHIDVKIPDSLDSKHEKLLEKLKKASDDNFDSEYTDIQVKAHKEAVSLFSGYAKHGDNDALKTLAKDTLPTLKEHKKMADDLKSNQ